MSKPAKKFAKDSAKIAFDKKHRKTISFSTNNYKKAFEKGKSQFKNLDKSKEQAAFIRNKVINNLDTYLIEFEKNFIENGGNLIWATDANEALSEIDKIMDEHMAKNVVKSKSMITEEIGLNKHLEASRKQVLETDLGEYIVQLADEKPYHIISPILHKSKEDIASLFNEKFKTSENATAEELTRFVRKKLRKEFVKADIGITGANFLLADTGSIALTENEGNGFLSFSYPKVHIVIAGIEKILPSVNDLPLFWTLLASHGTGQQITVYNSVVSGPKKKNEIDGPEKMYVILLDNGRTNLLAKEEFRIALQCIKCGACSYVCPVYKTIGGHTYNTTYTGPIGAITAPYLHNDLEKYMHLSYASTLCGACTNDCAVKIPLHKLLLLNRKNAVDKKLISRKEKLAVKSMTHVLQHRSLMNFGSGFFRNLVIKFAVNKSWGVHRANPVITAKSFNQIWKDKFK